MLYLLEKAGDVPFVRSLDGVSSSVHRRRLCIDMSSPANR